MSKASEWAARETDYQREHAELKRRYPDREAFRLPYGSGFIVCGEVDPDPVLGVCLRIPGPAQRISPTDAIAFARWILDMFSETPTAPPDPASGDPDAAAAAADRARDQERDEG